MVTLLLVMAGGAFGASCRFLIDRLAATRIREAMPVGVEVKPPIGTFTVNVAGSLLLGLFAGTAGSAADWAEPLVGTGFCGALTTYSTFGYETVRLSTHRPGGRGWAVLNVAATVTVGLAALGLGRLLGSAC